MNNTIIRNFNLLEEIKYAVLREYYKDDFDMNRIDLLSDYYDYVRTCDTENVMTLEQWSSENNNTKIAA